MTFRWKLVGVSVFLLVFCYAALAALDDILERKFERPTSLVQGRHFSYAPVGQVVDGIFGWSDLDGRISLPESLSETDVAPVGVRFFLGTGGTPLANCHVQAKFSRGTHSFLCTANDVVALHNDAWNAMRLDCLRTKGTEDGNWLRLHACQPALSRFALYSVDSSANRKTAGVALEVLASRYPDDKPAISWREAKKFGVDWNERLFTAVENLSRVLLAIVFPLLLWISVAFIRRKFFLAGCGLWTVWVILLFAVCLRTPPFQQPDEPQHFLGLVSKFHGEEGRSKLQRHGLELAARTHFNEITKTRDTVIRFDAHGERSWGEEHSSASEPDSRSIWYGWAAEYIIARGVATWETSFSFVNDLVLNLRFWLMIPLCVVVLLCAAFHGVMRRPYSLCLLFVMALVPVHVSLAAGITNYGFAILLGACTGSFLFPEGRKRARMLAAVLCGFGLFWVASSSRPCQPLFVVGPFLLMAWPWYAGLMYKKSEAMIPGLLAVGAFLAPVVMLRNTVSVDAWFSQFEPLFNTFVAKLPESSSRLFSTVPRSWFLFSVIGGVGGSTVSMLPLKGVANASALRLWVIAMVVSGWLVLLALAAFFFPVTEFAPNIRFLGDAIPEFSEFLKAVFRSFASQVFSGSQDYYLWQTYFLAYGWLDTTAPQPIYAALKQLVVLAVGISLVGVGSGFILWFRVFCIPFLFAIALWLGALYGAWMTGHTLLGRYVAPFAFLFVIPLFSALYFVLPLQSSPKKLHSGIVVAFFCILGFVLLNFYGVVWLLPTRYLVGI